MPNLTLQKIKCLEKTGTCPKPPYPKNKTGVSFNGNMNIPGSSVTQMMRYSAKITAKHTGHSKMVYVPNKLNKYGYYSTKLHSSYGMPPRNKF